MKISPPAATPVDKDKEIIIIHKTSPIKKPLSEKTYHKEL